MATKNIYFGSIGPFPYDGTIETDDHALRKEDIDDAIAAGGAPSGGIMLWFGSVASIPSGWLLCDGTNGTPDLRGVFLIGAGGAYTVGATGGASSVTLTTNEMPAHSHGGFTGAGQTAIAGSTSHSGTTGTDFTATEVTVPLTNHTHTIPSSGNGAAHTNMPPYHALCYIMKA